MISRRSLVFGGLAFPSLSLAGVAAWRARQKQIVADSCFECFEDDWTRYGYSKLYHSLFELSRSDRLRVLATGLRIRPEIQKAFGGERLYAPVHGSLEVLSTTEMETFELHKVRLDLECGLPVLGCAAMPRSTVRALVLLAHGMGTTPERCFNLEYPDYMKAIGARLCAAGFAVWCPFLPQAGNQPSQNNLVGMLSLNGVSYHNAACSALNLGTWVMPQFKAPELRTFRYGMSWGSVVASNLEAATGALAPTVLSGYLRDEEKLIESAWLETRAGQDFVTYLHEMPDASECFFPRLAWLTRPCRIYFEVGDKDELNNNAFGREEAFGKVKEAYREIDASDAVTEELFAGGHEVAGSKAIAWLQAL